MNKFKYNETIEHLEIDPLYLEEGLSYAYNNGYKNIRIFSLNINNSAITLDLSAFYNKSFISSLIISDDFKVNKITNTEALYSLDNLESLSCSQKIKLDFSFLDKLKKLYILYNKNLINLNKLVFVEDLFLRSFNEENCSIINKMKSVKKIRLLGSYTSLDGIEGMRRLESLSLIFSPKVVDALKINGLSNLVYLYIEKCKNLSDFSFFNGNDSIEEIFISELDSVSFVPEMNKIKSIKFWNLKDGDLNPILKSKTLKSVYFYPDKRNYNYKLDEITEFLSNKSSQ
ncbi:hypothetical protein [Yersinia pseudotuberculosis]|uniref:hypothetical protein n=1 Tax=Yersinia pseudotuberculosis TaxID=633 RepID=UPI0005E6DAB4|nr:hypothetical protein [Yersinia pseudotuberculosis]CND50589.1 Uncharacterised protein [Yersinia pseudotuberculosis]